MCGIICITEFSIPEYFIRCYSSRVGRIFIINGETDQQVQLEDEITTDWYRGMTRRIQV